MLCRVFLPVPVEERVFPLPSFQLISSSGEMEETIISEGKITAHFSSPQKLNMGDKTSINLYLDVDESIKSLQGSMVGEKNVLAEARIDLPLVLIQPDGTISQPFNLVSPLHFHWDVESYQEGVAEGQLWVYLSLVSQTGETDRHAMLAVPVYLEQAALFGLSENQISWIGAGFLIAGVFIFPIKKYIHMRGI